MGKLRIYPLFGGFYGTVQSVGIINWASRADVDVLKAANAGELGELKAGTYIAVPHESTRGDDERRAFLINIEVEQTRSYRQAPPE